MSEHNRLLLQEIMQELDVSLSGNAEINRWLENG